MDIPATQLQDAIVELVGVLRNRSISATYTQGTLCIGTCALDVSFDKSGFVTLAMTDCGVFVCSATSDPARALQILDSLVQSMISRRK